MHVHLDDENCLEILAVRGQGRHRCQHGDCMLGLKGVRHGRLTCVATGSTMSGTHMHEHH
jgi:CopG family nickel-responsive transcriptional regulator